MTISVETNIQLVQTAKALSESILAMPHIRQMGGSALPSFTEVGEFLDHLMALLYPGFFGRRRWAVQTVWDVTPELVRELHNRLRALIETFLRHRSEAEDSLGSHEAPDSKANKLSLEFLGTMPAMRERLAEDVRAAYEGDPAATDTDEPILCYPGVYAVTVYRIAHTLHLLKVPLLPRLLTEFAHARTGIDIHPGAQIGRQFFIDHGTGVVIGETALIGDRCKLYQGVTLGALSFPHDERGRIIRGRKRHPTLEDDVTIYANACVLGGDTVIGRGATLGGSVFVTKSVPAGAIVKVECEVRTVTRNPAPAKT